MADAFALGKLLVERRDISTKEEISQLLRDYEKEMIPRATFWVLESRKSGVMFRDDFSNLQALANNKE
jgi:2-polyprenyl-6-methoxyphenol hydroxylase-like FAD-dependent oxidoreductase